MFTAKFYSNKNRGDNLTLRITNNRSKTEISLGIRMTQEELDSALAGKSKNARMEKMLARWNAEIKDLMVELADSKQGDMDAKGIRSIMENRLLGREAGERKPGNFVPAYRGFMESKTNKGTKGVYKHTCDKMHYFDSDIDNKCFEDIDVKWLTDFEAFCAETSTKNARNIHLRNIRAVFNYAIDNEITTAYPFRRFRIRPEETRKRSLTVDALRRLFDYPVEPYAEIYRDMFKLIFMLVGINTVDLHRLREVTSAGRVEYRRAKTHRLYSIKVEPEAMEIIEKYKGLNGLLCIADRWSDHRNFRHQLNKALQRIGEMERKGLGGKKIITPEFDGLTSYWARHSWATIAYKIGVSKDVIAKALGHSDGHDTTNIYIDEDNCLVDEANRRVLDWVLYGKE